jgi:hypothetical protein
MKQLKAVCKKCSEATLKVYSSNIRRLYKIYQGTPIKTLSELPKQSTWLMSDKMKKLYGKFPNNIRRHLSSAGFIGTKMYGIKENNEWNKRMIEDAKEYESSRSRNKKSKYEEENIPEGGLKDLKKALKIYKLQIKHIFNREPTLSNLYKYQLFLALKLMASEIFFRNDLPTINIEQEKGNYLAKNKGGYKIIMQKFKNSDKIGPKEVKLNRANSMEMKRFLRYRDQVVDHDFLFSLKSGKPMTKSAFGQSLIKLTSNLLNKKVGSRLIRVMFASENKEILAKADDVSNKMLHSKSSRQTRQYVRK